MDTNWLAEIPAYAMEHPYLAAALGLLPSVNKGVSKAADLLMAPLVREKARRDMLSRAQTEQDIQAIKEGRAHFDGKGLVPAMPELTPLHDYQPFWQGLPPQQLPMAAALQEEGENLHTTLALAMEELARTPDDKVSDKAVDKDWFSRWRAEARLVTSDELRRMWARILVEEVKEPEAVSLKTLDVLKNLTKKDIQIFINVARFAINGIVYSKSETRKNYRFLIDSDNISYLQDIGLLSETDFLAAKSIRFLGEKDFCFLGYGVKFYIKDEINSMYLNRPYITTGLSLPGRELLFIADNIQPLSYDEVLAMKQFIFDAFNGIKNIYIVRYAIDDVSKKYTTYSMYSKKHLIEVR